jgi:hypothetical protein
MFPTPLVDNATFPPNSYRSRESASLLESWPGKVSLYWLDNNPDDFGLCLVVIDGIVKDAVLIKG